jgi:hypothetical protein
LSVHPGKEGPHLNASQRRSVEALLESVEAMLAQVERLLPDSGGHENSVTAVTNDLPPHFIARAPEKINEARRQIEQLADTIHLTRRRISKRRTVKGMLSAQMMRVEDITPARLRGFGEVHSSFSEQVSPALSDIRKSLQELVDLLQD